MRLVQTLSEALARTRDAQQFQAQTEVALLTACDVESLSPGLGEAPALLGAAPGPKTSPPDEQPVVQSSSAPITNPPAPRPAADGSGILTLRWLDVVDQVRSRNGLLASALGS